MSAEAMAWAWKQAPRCGNQGNYLVLLALAEHANPEGEGFPGRAKIAQMCGFSDKGTVTRNINKLIGLGLVRKGPRFDPAREGRQTSNIYELPLEEAPATPPAAQAATPPVAPQATPPDGATSQPRKQQPLKQQQEPQSVSADVQKVYDRFLAIFEPKTPPKLGPSLIRQIEKGLKEYDADGLCRAVDGLKEWRRHKPGKETLGAIFDTYPGGKPLTEQIAFFISQAKGATGVGKFPSADRAIVAEKQRLVQRGHRLSQNEDAVKQAKDAEAWLRQHGIETVKTGNVPVFRPVHVAADEDAGGDR